MHAHDERAAEGLEHLQAAARELIAAARAFLDVAEDVVADRDKIAEVVSAFGTIAEAAGQATRDASRRRAGAPGTDEDEPPTDRVQRIKVS